MKRVLTLIILIGVVITSSGCQGIEHSYRNDVNGRIAELFFPREDSLPGKTSYELEFRKTITYEGYYLKLAFDSTSAYEEFLSQTELKYSDITQSQIQNSSFIIDCTRFKVEDYSFRVIDLSPYGFVNEPYVGLIAHCDSACAIVFLYFRNEFSGIESISEGMGPDGYMEFYADSWNETEGNTGGGT